MAGFAVAALLVAAVPAAAATPAAWTASDRAAAAACAKVSDLRGAAVRTAVRFSDVLGVDAMLVTGKWRPAHMRGKTATMLCLYHRRDKAAEVVEAPGWRIP